MRPFKIGELTRRSGCTVKAIRFYEAMELLPRPARSPAGYRLYTEADIHRLRFIKRSRSLGFSTRQIETLLGLWNNRSRASSEVKKLAQAHADELAAKIAQMQAMQRTLQDLARRCHGDGRPECPILDDLAMADDQPPVPRHR